MISTYRCPSRISGCLACVLFVTLATVGMTDAVGETELHSQPSVQSTSTVALAGPNDQIAAGEQPNTPASPRSADAPPASARRARAGMRAGLRPGGLMDVALKEPLLKELGIEHDVAKIAEIQKLRDAMKHELISITRKMNPRDFRAQASDIQRKLQAKYNVELKKILTPAQFSRLQQINWQLEGPGALEDADIVQALVITKEQQQKLVDLIVENHSQVLKVLNPGGKRGPPGEKDAEAKLRALNAERDNKINQILSKTQQEKFANLKGKPFDLALLRRATSLRAGETGVVIDIKDPGMQVSVNGGMGVAVSAIGRPRKQEVAVEPGEHGLTITALGRPQFTTKDSFSIEKGQKRSVVVSIVDKQIVVKLDDQLLPLMLTADKGRGKKK